MTESLESIARLHKLNC